MSQHDQVIENASGATVRADINAALAALFGQSSGSSAPGTTIAYQLWADTTANLLKQRNAANSAWLVRGTLAESFVLSRSTNTILGVGDVGRLIVATASFTQTLTAAATLLDGWFIDYRVEPGATITFDPNASETIDGATTKAVTGPASGRIYCNGTAFYTVGLDAITLATEQATTSGTTKDFTGIPAGVRRIKMMFDGVSIDSAGSFNITIGDSGGLEVSGYMSTAVRIDGGGSTFNSNSNAFLIANVGASTSVYSGTVTLDLENASTNNWVMTSTLKGTISELQLAAGAKALSGMLDRLRLTASANFDAGAVNISY